MTNVKPTRHGNGFKDETGNRYGNLTVLRRDSNGPHKKAYWICRCDCGAVKSIWWAELRKGSYKSCSHACPTHSHGMAGTAEHNCWASMLDRCRNKNHPQYHDWGGRGIKVCDRWKSFRNFLSDMGLKPFPVATLERIDNDGDYCPENCRWATWKDQRRNTRRNVYLTCNGETKCITDWAVAIGASANTIRDRLKRGWPVERAITTPPDKRFYKKSDG